MKNLMLLVAVFAMSSTAFAGECTSLSCNRPVRKTVTRVVDVTRTVVTAPVKVLNKTVANVQARRYARRCNSCN
jgi:hypothetical protein